MLDEARSGVFVLSVIRGVSAAVFAMTVPFLNIYLYERGYSMSLIGFVSGLSTFLGSITRIVSGGLFDVVHPMRIMLYGVLLRVLALVLMAVLVLLEAPISSFALALFLNSVAFSLIINASNSFLGYTFRDGKRRILAISKVRVGINLGFSLGPVVGGFLASYSYAANLAASVLVSASVIPFVIWFLRGRQESLREMPNLREYLQSMRLPVEDRMFVLVCISSLFSAAVFSQFSNTLPVFAVHYSIDKKLVGYLFTVNGAAVILLQVWITRMSSKVFGSFGSSLLGLFLYALSFIMFGASQNFLWLILAVFQMTVGEMLLIPSLTNTAMRFSPENRKGIYLGFFEFSEIVGWTLGKYLGGVVFDNLVSRPVQMWGVLASITLFPFVTILLVMYEARRRRPRRNVF